MTDPTAAVRDVEQRYDEAWQRGDLDGILACLHPAAVLVSPRGEAARGHREIRTVLGRLLDGEAAGSLHESTIERVELVTDDVAVVDGRARVTGVAPSLGGEAAVVVHGFIDVLVRRDGRWVISQIRAYGLESPSR
ncbi:MAG: nuclear transport factor 2 family protein [Actinomycetota bacterium]|nr:nuclear transport factor 2 family protein [Actinomycetota bacterium]